MESGQLSTAFADSPEKNGSNTTNQTKENHQEETVTSSWTQPKEATYRVTTTKDHQRPTKKRTKLHRLMPSRSSRLFPTKPRLGLFSWLIQWISRGQLMLLQMFSSTPWNSKCQSLRSPNQDVLQSVSTTARYDPCRLQGCDVG